MYFSKLNNLCTKHQTFFLKKQTKHSTDAAGHAEGSN